MSQHGEGSIYDGVKPETREIAKTVPTAVVLREPPKQNEKLEPAPTVGIELIGPEEAKHILGSAAMNRNAQGWRISKYARDMAADRWHLNGETIKIDSRGRLVDGQHRLRAVIESGRIVSMVVVRGLAPDVHETVDIGAKRSMGDILSIKGYQNSTATAGAVRLAYYLERFPGMAPAASPSIRASEEELLSYLAANPGIAQSTMVAKIVNKKIRIAPSVVGAIHYIGGKVQPKMAGPFWDAVATGADLEKNTAPWALREALFNDTRKHPADRMNENAMSAVVIKAWNYYCAFKPIRVLRWMRSESFPRIGDKPK